MLQLHRLHLHPLFTGLRDPALEAPPWRSSQKPHPGGPGADSRRPHDRQTENGGGDVGVDFAEKRNRPSMDTAHTYAPCPYAPCPSMKVFFFAPCATSELFFQAPCPTSELFFQFFDCGRVLFQAPCPTSDSFCVKRRVQQENYFFKRRVQRTSLVHAPFPTSDFVGQAQCPTNLVFWVKRLFSNFVPPPPPPTARRHRLGVDARC